MARDLALGRIVWIASAASYQANLSGEEFLQHALLELASFGQLRFQRRDFRVHVAQHFGDTNLPFDCW